MGTFGRELSWVGDLRVGDEGVGHVRRGRSSEESVLRRGRSRRRREGDRSVGGRGDLREEGGGKEESQQEQDREGLERRNASKTQELT